MRLTVAVIACVLSACTASTRLQMEYWNASVRPILVPVDIPNSSIKFLEVRVHPQDATRVGVSPTYGSQARESWANTPASWAARAEEHRMTYTSALETALEQLGRSCSVEHATPHPGRYMFEFQLACSDTE